VKTELPNSVHAIECFLPNTGQRMANCVVSTRGFIAAALFVVVGIYVVIYVRTRDLTESWTQPAHRWKGNAQNQSSSVSIIHSVPSFTFYVRFTYTPRFANEYRNVLVRSMKLFVPNNIAKLVVVLDAERPENKKFAEEIKKEWPYPEICFRDPGDPKVYYNWGKGRMFWDMMHPDLCTNATYVGFVDTDTFFDTLVTPQLLFEESKPVIVGKIGLAPYACWEKTTERFLRKKEVMQCMSTFPVTVKADHMREMREKLSKQFGKDFATVFRESANGVAWCICQFSLMCNYMWYHHRDEYAWHLQTVPNGDWNGADVRDGQVDANYYHTEVKPEMKVPIPRTSVHLRYMILKGVWYDSREPPKQEINEIVKEGLCYSAGFQYCPEQCKKWKQSAVQYHLYSFEFYQWFWDSRCKAEQDKHYRNAKELVDYHVKNKHEIFGLQSIQDLCKTITDWQY